QPNDGLQEEERRERGCRDRHHVVDCARSRIAAADGISSSDLASSGKGRSMRAVYRWWTGIVFAGVLIQIAFAGYGAFYTVDKADKAGETISHHGIDHGWALHSAFGTIVIGLGILLIPIAFAAKVDRERK